MYTGLADQAALANTDFLTNPRALVGVVLDGVKVRIRASPNPNPNPNTLTLTLTLTP